MHEFDSVAICATDDSLGDFASAMAKRLDTNLLNSCNDATAPQFILTITTNPQFDYQWELRFPAEKLSPVFVDFNNQQLVYRLKFGGGHKQAIARALGLKKGQSPLVIDATAGTGRDGFILWSLGCHVHMLERNPIIHALLEDGLRRLKLSENWDITGNQSLQLTHSDSREWLKSSTQTIDIIYLDPMYPHRSKSALVKKEMRILRQLVGDDADVNELVESALKIAKQRVVVKRPKFAEPIGSIKPSHCIESKNTRFDIYLTRI